MGEAKARGCLRQELVTPDRGAAFLFTPLLAHDVSWWSSVKGWVRTSACLGASDHLCWSRSWSEGKLEAAEA